MCHDNVNVSKLFLLIEIRIHEFCELKPQKAKLTIITVKTPHMYYPNKYMFIIFVTGNFFKRDVSVSQRKVNFPKIELLKLMYENTIVVNF